MITSNEALQLSLNALEKKFKKELDLIAKYITDSCQKGETFVFIPSADKLFPDTKIFALFLNKKYGYSVFLSSTGDLTVKWN